MRVFTCAEKQQLQSKIKDEQERQQVLREIRQIENEKEPKGMKGVISRKYSILGFILFLIVLNVILLLSRQNYDYHGAYLNLVVALMLLITLRTISQKAVG
jgi:hypothetical protein